MRGKNILSMSLVMMFVTVAMMDIQLVQATNTYEYELYVDGFDWSIVSGWTYYGTEPWLDAMNDGNYIESSEYCGLIGFFTFEDIKLQPCEAITRVMLEGYTRSADLEIEGDGFTPDWVWVGSLWGTSTWDWHTPRYFPVLSDVVKDTLTVIGLNNFKVLLHYWTPTHVSYGPFEIDCLRLRVYTAVSAIIFIDPETLHIAATDPGNAPVTVYIELPPCTGYDVCDIDPDSVQLEGLQRIGPWACDDGGGTPSISDMKVQFDRSAVCDYIKNVLGITEAPPPDGKDVILNVRGNFTDGTPFKGSGTVKVIIT